MKNNNMIFTKSVDYIQYKVKDILEKVSQKDIEICLDFNLDSLTDHPRIDDIRTIHETIQLEYGGNDGE